MCSVRISRAQRICGNRTRIARFLLRLDGPGPSIPSDQPRLATGGLFRWGKRPPGTRDFHLVKASS
jgi:hypothetical protein